MIVIDNLNNIETNAVKKANTKTNIEIHRTWGQGEIFGKIGDYRDFFEA
jgi:hypothetical protein